MSRSKPNIAPKPLIALLENCKVEYDEHDLFLLGDGSGLTWEIGGGYAAFLIDRKKQLRKHIIGACTLTTINRMELSAYTEALSYHYECIMEQRITDPPYRVAILTDSELTARVGTGIYGRKANRDLWQVVDWFESRGYRIKWHWVPRNSTPYHELADYLAGAARRSIMELRLDETEIYDIAPYTKPAQQQVDLLAKCRKCGTPYLSGTKHCFICGEPTEREEQAGGSKNEET